MKKKSLYLILLLSLLTLTTLTPKSFAQVPDTVPLTNLRAGIAKVDITPPIGIHLAGYQLRKGPSKDVHDSLHATILVFDDRERKATIVALDLIQVLQSSGNAIKKAIKESVGIPEDHIMINASHTHGSPWLKEETIYKGPWNDEDSTYTNEVIEKVVDAAKLAVSRLRPISIGYGEGEIDFNVSRRWVDEEGICHGMLNPEGICDHRVKILRIDDGNDVAPMAVVMHAVCHPNVYRALNTEISGDFPSFAQSFVEHNFGDRTTSMFLQGCTGDIRPYLLPVEGGYSSKYRNGDKVDMIWCGWSLGAEAVKVATKLRIREQVEKRTQVFKISAASDILKLEADETKLEGMNYLRDRIENGKVVVPIQVLRIGDFWFVGLPGEPVVEYGLKIEEKMKDLGKIFVLGYIPGDNGYIPVAHMLAKSGYEAEGPYTQSAESKIIEGVKKLVSKLTKESQQDKK